MTTDAKPLLVLGIETSCDETALALVEVRSDGSSSVVKEVIASQISLHQLYGGVVPELAAREHLQSLPTLFGILQSECPNECRRIDLIAVTSGPGLKGCLLMGINFASGLSITRNIPLITVNHIEGHIYSAFLNKQIPKTPFLSLIVSGGHTELMLIERLGAYKNLARTIDDAAGEAFDKSAHLLGFPYPGGKALAETADAAVDVTSDYQLPKIMREAEGFSFSGLKTAIRQLIHRQQPALKGSPARVLLPTETIQKLSITIQNSIVDSLIFKLKKAVEGYGAALKILSVVGGVSANLRLRQEVAAEFQGHQIFFPELKFSTDNAAMIALVGGLRFAAGLTAPTRNIAVMPRWPVEQMNS